MSQEKLAKDILLLVGGKNNVDNLVHCMTRLRFNLKNESLAEEEKIKALNGVMGVARNGGQFQVIVGNKVKDVYKELADMLGIMNNSQEDCSKDNEKKKKSNMLSLILDNVAGIFLPIAFALSSVGMLKGILVLTTMLKLISAESELYKIIEAICDGAFYFIPVLLAFSTAKKIKTNEFGAVVISLFMLSPSFISLVNSKPATAKLLDFQLPAINYSYSIIAVIVAVWLYSYVDKLINKLLTDTLKPFIGPALTLLITAIATITIIGPIGDYLDNGIIFILSILFTKAGLFTGLIIGGIFSLIIMTGMHYVVISIMVVSLTKLGFDYLMPIMLMANIGQAGAAFGVFLKTRNMELKDASRSATISALMGVTEPAMFGINHKLKKPFIAAGIGSALGGAVSGAFGAKVIGMGPASLISFPVYLGNTFVYVIAGVIAAFIAAMIVTFALGFEDTESNNEEYSPKITADDEKDNKEVSKSNDEICSPITGKVKKLSEVNDVTFAEEMMGKGVAIEPEEGRVVSPVNGVVGSIFGTRHAIGLLSDNGAEILIHIGLDTVKLGGKYFTTHVKEGDRVNVGDLIAEFDVEKIKSEGFEVITPIIITNSDDYSSIEINKASYINEGEWLLELKA